VGTVFNVIWYEVIMYAHIADIDMWSSLDLSGQVITSRDVVERI